MRDSLNLKKLYGSLSMIFCEEFDCEIPLKLNYKHMPYITGLRVRSYFILFIDTLDRVGHGEFKSLNIVSI